MHARTPGRQPAAPLDGHEPSGDHPAEYSTTVRREWLRPVDQGQRLPKLLLDSRVPDARGAGDTALGLQAIVTFTGIQPEDPATSQDEAIDGRRRESVLRHELSHGLLFTRAAYREDCWRFWRTRLSAKEPAAFIRFLSGLNDDAHNEELLVNEVLALPMHTPDTRAFDAASVGMTDAQLDNLRTRFREGLPVR